MKTTARPRLLAALIASAAALAGTGLQAQVTTLRGDRGPVEAEESPSQLAWGAAVQPIERDRLASELIGTRIRNWKGQDLGHIVELMIDVNNGLVNYAVLHFEGGPFDPGDKLFPYPVTLLRQGTGGELILNVPQDALERAPGFARSRWPDWSDRAYGEQLNRYYGPKVVVRQGPNQELRRASELIGAEVRDASGRTAGEIRDVVADLDAGTVRYVVLDFEPSWGPPDKMIALPLESFGFASEDSEVLVLQRPRERIDMSRAFDEERWPNFEDKAYRSGIDGIPGGPPRPQDGSPRR